VNEDANIRRPPRKKAGDLTEYPVIAKNLTYRVGWRKTIIEGVSLALKKGEFVGLIGGSGSGKTTLLTCLNGHRQASDGAVAINGETGRPTEKVRRLIGYVPQDDIVHKTLTVERALHYACLLRLDEATPEEKIEYRVGKILYQLDLRDHKDKKIGSLSGGQRKRVNIGVELLHSPRLFFLDEPTAGLDPGLERQLMKLMAALAKSDRTVVMTTHLMQHADMFDILIFIHKGRMVYFGPSETITDFFRVKDLVELFETVMPADPDDLRNRYYQSSVCRKYLLPRLDFPVYVQ
jgi:ABC-type multidrug transport system ATPase subunit